MKKLISIIMCICLLAGLAACGGDKYSMDFSKLEPAANVKISDIDAGLIRDADKTSDNWYANGKEGGAYMYVVDSTAPAGLSCCIVDENGNETEYYSCENENEHLVYNKDGLNLDIVFYDALTAYDYVSETWYSRGSVKKMESYISGKKFVDADNTIIIVFNEDGTVVETSDGEEYTGTWYVANSTQIFEDIDGYGPTDFDLIFDESGNFTGITHFYAYRDDLVLVPAE